MKRSKKVLIIIAVSLIVLGIVMLFLASSTLGFNIFMSPEYLLFGGTLVGSGDEALTNSSKVTEYLSTDFERIEIDCRDCRVALFYMTSSPDYENKCSVEFTKYDEDKFSFEVSDNVLRIKQIKKEKWYEKLGFNDGRYHEIWINIPKKEFKQADIKSASGDVFIDGYFVDLNIETKSGNIYYGADVSGDAVLQSTSGNIEVSGEYSFRRTTPKSMTVTSTSGDLKFKKFGDDVDFSVCTTSGDIKFEDSRGGNIAIASTSGEIKIIDTTISGKMNVASTSGDISIVDSDADSLKLKSASGDITGTLLSDKIFKAKSKSGDIKVPDIGGGGKCEIETTSGDIRFWK